MHRRSQNPFKFLHRSEITSSSKRRRCSASFSHPPPLRPPIPAVADVLNSPQLLNHGPRARRDFPFRVRRGKRHNIPIPPAGDDKQVSLCQIKLGPASRSRGQSASAVPRAHPHGRCQAPRSHAQDAKLTTFGNSYEVFSACEKRNVECFRPERRPSFRQGSAANYDGAFSQEQRWVNSRPRAFRFDSRAPNSTPTTTQEKEISNDTPASYAQSLPDTGVAVCHVLHETGRTLSEAPALVNHDRGVEDVQPPIPTPTKRRRTEPAPQDGGHFFPASPAGSGASRASPWSNTALSTGRVRLRED
ncbi:hypothetical protein CSAL01_08216 [Colletotrichum salicis]|uniref:Uncharacterized protein n=1 Tax=Colletotrichum salicis TaxID=1209931 RepID=A0A135U621_9PEZI|nr:hypothetical protein CSAL01_08216 [Colletotrichum salicis]